jgi:hypothetical protein
VLSDIRLPSGNGWKMTVNSIGIPSAPTLGMDRWDQEFWAHRRSLSPTERANPTWAATGNGD